MSVPGGRHHGGGAAQHEQRPLLPHNYRQVRRTCCYLHVHCFIVALPCTANAHFGHFTNPRRPANPNSPCSSSLPSDPAPPETASPPQAPKITPSVSASQPCTCFRGFKSWTMIVFVFKKCFVFFLILPDDILRWLGFHHGQSE